MTSTFPHQPEEVRISIEDSHVSTANSRRSIESIWNNRIVVILSNKIRHLEKKISKEESCGHRYNDCKSIALCETTSLLGIAAIITGIIFLSVFSDSKKKQQWETGTALTAFGASLLFVPLGMYIRHRYKLSHGKYPHWIEQIKVLENFKHRIAHQQNISSDVLSELFFHPDISSSVKKQVSDSSSLSMHFEVASKATNEEINETLYSLMHPNQKAILNFVLNPFDYDEDRLLTGLVQYRSYFVAHPQLLDCFTDRSPRNFLEREDVEEVLRKMKIDQANIKPLTPKAHKVQIELKGMKINISWQRLTRYPKVIQCLQPNDHSDHGETYTFSLREGQDPEIVLSILLWIQTRKLQISDVKFPGLIKDAHFLGVNNLIRSILAKQLHQVQHSSFSKHQRARKYLNLIRMIPPSNYSAIRDAIEREYGKSSELCAINDVRFWLEFANEHAPDEVFHEFSKLPIELTPEFVDMIYEMRPYRLFNALNRKLQEDCCSSDVPIQMIEKYAQNQAAFFMLTDTLLAYNPDQYIVPLWNMACSQNSSALKNKVSSYLTKNHYLNNKWSFLDLPEELRDLLKNS